MMRIQSTRLLLAGAALWAAASPALALDGQDLVKKMVAAANLQPSNLTVGGVDVSGTTVTLKGVSLGDDKGGERVNVGDVVLEGVEEQDDGGYSVEKAVFPDVNMTEDKTTITVKDMYLSGVVIPGDPNGNSIDSMLFYEEAHSGPMNIAVEGKNVASIKESSLNIERTEDNSGFSYNMLVDGVSVDFTTVDDPKFKESLDSLGLTKIDGKITMEGDWETDPGTINVTEFAMDFANVGKLDLAFSLSGYTIPFIKSIQETTKAMQENPNKEAAQQAAGLAMLGLLQQISFNSAEISFDDDGITKRSLSYAGKAQGVSGEQMAMMVKGMAPLMMAQLNMPSLQNSVSAAINSFLDNPKNFTITADPKNPIPLPMILGAAQAAPNTLPEMLGISVAANQ